MFSKGSKINVFDGRWNKNTCHESVWILREKEYDVIKLSVDYNNFYLNSMMTPSLVASL